MKNFFNRRSLRQSFDDEKGEDARNPLTQRPKTANTAALPPPFAHIEQPRLYGRPQTSSRPPTSSSSLTSNSRKRPRRHTDAAAYQSNGYIPPIPPIPPIDSKYVEIDYDARSMTGSTRQRYSEDVADRNLRLVRPDGQLPTTGRSVDILDHNLPGYPRVVAEKSRYSEGVADRNLSMSTTSTSSKSNTSSSLAHIRVWGDQVKAFADPETETFASRFPNDEHVKTPIKLERMASTRSSHGNTIMFVPPAEVDGFSDSYFDDELYPISSMDEARRDSMRRRSSLASPPSETSRHERMPTKVDPSKSLTSLVSSLALSEPPEIEPLNVPKREHTPPPIPQTPPPIPRRATGHTPEHSRRMSLQFNESARKSSEADSAQPVQPPVDDLTEKTSKLDLSGIGIDLTNTTETHLHEHYDPAVTKEVIKPTMHEIRQEQITREIHNHDIFHRILPVKDVEIIPSRHFMRDEAGNVQEIPASAVPYGTNTVLEVKNVVNEKNYHLVPRRFTASTLEGFAEDFADRVDPDGVTRSHTTWIHSPVIQNMGRETGQTVPFEIFGAETSHSGQRRGSNDWHDL